MSAENFGYVVGSFLVQLLIGYIVAMVVRPKKRPNGAFIAAVVVAFLLAGAAALNGATIKPFIAWILAAAFFYWKFSGSLRRRDDAVAEENGTDTSAMAERSVVVASEMHASANYFVRHWHGDISLGISYWVNGALLAGIFPVFILWLIGQVIEQTSKSIFVVAWFYIFAVVFALALWVWGVVGIWRSAGKHRSRGGGGFAAGAARVLVVLGAFSVISQMFTSYGPMLKDMVSIVSGRDALGTYKITVLADGKSIRIQGALSAGVAKDFERLLGMTPSAKTLVLSSHGGRLLEGKLLADLVVRQGLDTYVEEICASTCTFVFLAGRDRAATPSAKVGFHSPYAADQDAQKAGMQYMLDIYKKAGLPSAFLDKVRKTHSSDMWYPTREELISARVITRVSLGGETASAFVGITSKDEFVSLFRADPLFSAMENRYPSVMMKAMNRAWTVKEKGGNDGQVLSASRGVVAELIPVLLREADLALVEDYVSMALEQAQAAKNVSNEACYAYFKAELNPYSVFPESLVKKESDLTLRMMQSSPVKVRSFSDLEVDQALQIVRSNLSQMHLAALSNPDDYQARPDLVCDGNIAFFKAILSLPKSQRGAALEGLFKS